MVLACFVNDWNRCSGGYENTLGLALFVEKSTPYENSVPLPLSCTLDTSTGEMPKLI
jgi:hypothetical protein